MAVHGKVFGYGSATYQNVMRVKFTHPLSSKVSFECYDSTDDLFPVTDTLTSTENQIFGSDELSSSQSMIALHELSSPAAVTGWFPATLRANTGSVNLMKGTTSYVTQQSATLSSAGGGSINFNMQVKVVASMQTSYSTGFDVLVRYTYTSTTPAVSWLFNNEDSGGGTADVPVWAIATVDSHGLYHCRSGTATTDSSFLANIPETGQEKSGVGIFASVAA